MTYLDFLKSKIVVAPDSGIDIQESDINPILLPHQRASVLWAVRGGRRALFEAFGLGKTVQQLEICRLILSRKGGKALIICPLGVRQEFAHDAEKLLGLEIEYVKTRAEAMASAHDILITNYERVRDGDINPLDFTVCSLDEASVLRSYGSKTYQEFLAKFQGVPFKFVATATPSPNRFKELIHYAGFLEIMDTGQALTRFFQRDSSKAGNLTLHPHKEEEFWLWMSTWALFITKPSDLGYSDEGYDLPPLDIKYHMIKVDHGSAGADDDGQVKLFRDAALGLRDAAREKRDSIDARLDVMREIVEADPESHYILWHTLENERHAIKKAIPDAVEVYGSQDLDEREQRTIDFSEGRIRLLASKPEISGSGSNFQYHCHKAIFLGINYQFHDFIQAIHRIHRFLQKKVVEVHVIYAESESAILDALKAKWAQHNDLVATMSNIIQEYGLASTVVTEKLARTIGIGRAEYQGKRFLSVLNDCVLEMDRLADNSVDLIHTSIPFCYDEKTEVLTRRGWLSFGGVTEADYVATVHPTELCIQWQRPTHLTWEPYQGEMLHFTGRSFDHMVTPNHRMFAARRGINFSPDRFDLIEAGVIARTYQQSKRRNHSDGRILRGWRTCLVPPCRGNGKRPKTITIPALPAEVRNGHGVQLYWIETEDFMRLVGWYLSEGHADPFGAGRCGGRISIGQATVNQSFRDEIEGLFIRIGLPPTMSKNSIEVWCRNLAWYLQQEFGHGAAKKRIPTWVKELHPDLLEILRDTMMKGDGSKALNSYASISPRLRDDFQEICLVTGWRASVNDSKVVSVGQAQLFPEIRNAPKRVYYSGMIGCLTVPNHTLVVRRNGKAFVSGNSNHYEYTASYNDFGHNRDNGAFFEQMDFLTPELLRVLKPGRVAAIHTKDRILFGNATGTGMPTVDPFHAACIFHYMRHGFHFMGQIVVLTDVVRENNQTYRLGWTEQCKDGSKMGIGCPEYVLLFRKLPSDTSTAYADEPVTKTKAEYTRARWQIDANAMWRSSGDRLAMLEELRQTAVPDLQEAYRQFSRQAVYDYHEHLELSEDLDEDGKLPASFAVVAPGSWHPDVWDDVNRMRTLNGEQSRKDLREHTCPLQFDIVERIINRFSNSGELVLDPFAGLGTVPYMAVKMGRRGYGVELNYDSFRDGLAYLKAADEEAAAPTLFDMVEERAPAVAEEAQA